MLICMCSFVQESGILCIPIMICELKNKGVKSKTLFTSSVKEMNIEQPNIQTQWKGDTIFLNTDIPAFQVYLHGIDERFSDNFFTLLPNKEKSVVCTGADKKGLKIYTLADLKDKEQKNRNYVK